MFKVVTVVSAVASAFALSACAPMMSWNKPGASQAEFSQDRYDCMQQSQQQVSGAFINKYGGGSSTQVITNDGLFGSCLNARGWTLVKQSANPAQPGQPASPASDPIRAATDASVASFKEVCLRDDIKAMLDKTPCNSNLITLEQMADTSMITPEQKAALSRFRSENQSITAKLHAAYIQHGGAKGVKVVSVREQAMRRTEENQLALYEGKLTWGEYNKRRNEITKQARDDVNMAANSK